MMAINVQNLVMLVGLAGTIVGVIISMYRLFARFEKMERQAGHRKKDTEILLKTQLGILEGMIEQGCNGPCKKARDELIAHMAAER
nr:MAG TPA: hypothetical protein [Caudoviricetes sp.]